MAQSTDKPFVVFLRGRETEVARHRFQAPAEEDARSFARQYGRPAYVTDERLSVYDPPVYRVTP